MIIVDRLNANQQVRSDSQGACIAWALLEVWEGSHQAATEPLQIWPARLLSTDKLGSIRDGKAPQDQSARPGETLRRLTAGAIERLTCTPGKAPAFLRDAGGNGPRLRVTPTGKKTFVFEQSLKNPSIRRPIGDVSACTIPDARAEAKRLSVMLDARDSPRKLERQRAAEKAAAQAETEARAAADTTQPSAQAMTGMRGMPACPQGTRPGFDQVGHAVAGA